MLTVEMLMDNVNNDPVKPKRCIRYKGTHPRHFEGKYKELNFEKYPSDVDKVIQAGKTPAGEFRGHVLNYSIEFSFV